MTVTVVRSIGDRRTNAQAIADCATLGYLRADQRIADVSYGLGRFWTQWRPDEGNLWASDLNPERSPGLPVDFRATGYAPDSFDAVVFDPPYKLSGTNSGEGPAASNIDYGIDEYMSVANRMKLIYDGLTECARIVAPSGHVLVKCQDQVCSGRVHWQTIDIAIEAAMLWLELVDQLHVLSYRAQPAGRRQMHARRDYSTLLIFRKMTSPAGRPVATQLSLVAP